MNKQKILQFSQASSLSKKFSKTALQSGIICTYLYIKNVSVIYFYAIYPILLRVFLLSVYVHRMWLDIYYS